MLPAPSFPCATDEADSLRKLCTTVDKNYFQSAIRRFDILFDIYTRTSHAPLPAPMLIVTPEIRTQCEIYVPINEIAVIFKRLYTVALTYPPIFSSTPFHNTMSWADTFAVLPPQFQFSANPARLLESLLADDRLLTDFLFASFLPQRFYGATGGRYPGQHDIIRKWLTTRKGSSLRCLDAASGTGEGTYGIALLLSEMLFPPEEVLIEGWTVEPLEVWAATHRRFPHDPRREAMLRTTTSELLQRGYGSRISFHCADLTEISLCHALSTQETSNRDDLYDLIVCNGLLGGPIIHQNTQLDRTVSNLVQLLATGGILLAADNFHGGWKQKCPQDELRALYEKYGLITFEAGEGIGGLKPD